VHRLRSFAGIPDALWTTCPIHGQGNLLTAGGSKKERMQFLRHRLFSLFQRFHRDDEFEGAGVGLAIVHPTLQKRGGAIWAQSSRQKGAAFYFSVKDSRVWPDVPAASLRGDA